MHHADTIAAWYAHYGADNPVGTVAYWDQNHHHWSARRYADGWGIGGLYPVNSWGSATSLLTWEELMDRWVRMSVDTVQFSMDHAVYPPIQYEDYPITEQKPLFQYPGYTGTGPA